MDNLVEKKQISIEKKPLKLKVKPITRLNVGSRKTARSMVQLIQELNYTVNGKDLKTYFKEDRFVEDILRPIRLLESKSGFKARVKGGGISAQAWAIRYALSKTLAGDNADLKRKLKVVGLLSGDDRSVERKKVGKYKARAKFPFSRR